MPSSVSTLRKSLAPAPPIRRRHRHRPDLHGRAKDQVRWCGPDSTIEEELIAQSGRWTSRWSPSAPVERRADHVLLKLAASASSPAPRSRTRPHPRSSAPTRPSRLRKRRRADRPPHPAPLGRLPRSPPASSVVEVIAPPTFKGKTLKELELRKYYHVQVLGIKRRIPKGDPRLGLWEELIIDTPDAHEPLREGDAFIAVGNDTDLERFVGELEKER